VPYVQTTYRERPSRWTLGQVSTTRRQEADTVIAEGRIPFARGVMSADGVNGSIGAGATTFAGVSHRDIGVPPEDDDGFVTGRAVSVLTAGDIIVMPVGAVTAGQRVSVVSDTGEFTTGATPTQTGWATATNYNVGDIVSDSGNNYRCIRAHTSANGNVANGSPATSNQTAWVRWSGYFQIEGARWMSSAAAGELAEMRLTGSTNVTGV